MKNKIWIIIIVIVIVSVILLGILTLGRLDFTPDNQINYVREEVRVLDEEETIENKASQYIEDFLDFAVKEPVEVDNIYYNDVNSVPKYEYNVDNTYVDTNIITKGKEKCAKLSDSYIIKKNFRKDTFFDTDKVLIPTKLYLVDDSQPAYFIHDNNVYYIPIEKCTNEDEERIVFKDYNLIVMRKTGNITIFGKDININLSKNVSPDRFFDELYLKVPDANYDTYKFYETDIDNDSTTTDISLCALDYNTENGTFVRRVLVSKDQNEKIKIYNVPISLGGNIASFKNVFYSMYYTRGDYYNNYTKEYLPISYILFDKENGFSEVYRFANGDEVKFGVEDENLSKYPLTLSKELVLGEVPVDLNSEIKYSTRYSNLSSSTQKTLEAGTKIILVKIIDRYGNSIAKLEDGTLIEIANYTGLDTKDN